MLRKIISLILAFCFLFQQTGFSQIAGELDLSGHFQRLGGLFAQDTFRPLHLRYLSYDALSNNFNLLLDKGDQFKQGLSPQPANPKEAKGTVPDQTLTEETQKLMQYFSIGLALPNEAFWVNLRPDSPNNIIDDELARTDIGKIFLEVDLQLKKDTANFTSPQTPEGREYWDKLYKKAEELYGNENITIPTLTRPWIVPGEIIIRESKDNAYIYKATLKVMLEQDYLRDGSLQENRPYAFKDERSQALNEYSSQLIRELIIPKITKEVNSSKHYAALRQVYYSLILAQWFKQRFKGLSPQGTVPKLIDSRDLANLTSKEDWSKTTYLNEYKQSFAAGEYNIQEPRYTPTGQVIRSYFSGGLKMLMEPVVLTGPSSPIGDKPYLKRVAYRNGVVTQPLAGSSVLSQQEIENLKKELAFYLMGLHDIGNAGRILSNLSLGIQKGKLTNDGVKIDRIYELFRIERRYLEKGELSINDPLKLAEIIKELRSVHEEMKSEFIRLRPFFALNLQEEVDYILEILSPEPKIYNMNLAKVLEWVIDWYRKGYNYNITFTSASEKDDMHILGNRYLFKRIFANLIYNTEDVCVARGIKREDINIILEARNGNYIITYKDNAGGIPLYLIDNVFEQGVGSKNEPLSGYGLAICKELVEKMGGTISVQSEPGKGTTFTITLPAASSSPAAADSDTSASRPQGAPSSPISTEGRSEGPLTPGEQDEFDGLIRDKIIDANVYKEGSLEYEGLIQLIRYGESYGSLRAKGHLIKHLIEHKEFGVKGALLLETSSFFGWIKRELGEEAIKKLCRNLIFNIFFPPHKTIAYLLRYQWDRESLGFFIKILPEDKREALYLFSFSVLRPFEAGEQDRAVSILKDLALSNKVYSIDDVVDIIRQKIDYESPVDPQDAPSPGVKRESDGGQEPNNGSSPLGGIDMRYLAENTVIENRDSPLRGQSLFSAETASVELQEIQRLIQTGIIPATKRLEECRGACSAEALLSCIADILRIEEERVTATEAGLKNLLASL